ncbi:Bax inhibitor-1/YccA family protein [Alicyclobacillus sp. SO9]|uniref:Bax inhibitor-1/YccA family protein n=1 Tax=Alicyclobacillus sp. SO9 TaxID=2665646 RepID=UPI0018E903F1|nr:Bax inhibitor-1/YccA family protein [Alicyclobacillus sp. SO9]QQE79334.1 Bax inhibitor-1/YccA family protein [Alicyclobacillus sp. SO9]
MERFYDERHQAVRSGYMSKVYGWMFLALVITALVSLATVQSVVMSTIAVRGFWLFFLAAFGIVFFLSARITKMSSGTAVLWFLIYSAINGIWITPIVFRYTGETVALAFAVSALSFGVMSVYGAVTKTDLTRIGSLAFFGLIGIIIASLLNMLFRSSGFEFIISYLGVAIFTILTAWDTQRIKNNPAYQRYAIIGSLSLYLDFLNIFLFLLNIFGGGGARRG